MVSGDRLGVAAGVESVVGTRRRRAVSPHWPFAKRLSGYWRSILGRVRWSMHIGQLEGINNRIKVMKRMVYGYRVSEYFFLKIKAAFPDNP